MLVSQDVIPILHKLEQVSSDEHVGTLAENLMDALKEHPQVVKKVVDRFSLKYIVCYLYPNRF